MISIDAVLSKCLACTGVCYDTRQIKSEEFFIALKTPTNDGHLYVKEAFEKGAKFALIDNPKFNLNEYCILVDDVLDVFHQIAQKHRESFPNLKLIAIAGSNGKTTSKELIATVLSTQYKVYATLGNLNNHIGVPINLLKLTSEHDIAIIEMGANHLKEHEKLCKLVQPNFALVTNCGKDHLEGYGSIDAVIESNLEVYQSIKDHNGHLFVNENDDTLRSASQGISRSFYGKSSKIKEAYPYIKLLITSDYESIQISSKLYGFFQQANIEAAIHIGNYFNISLNHIKLAIEGYQPSNNRSERIEWKGNIVLLDAYNANPSSMMAMIDYFEAYPTDQKILILGSMAELGHETINEHKEILDRLSSFASNQVILIGESFKTLAKSYKRLYFSNSNEVKAYLESLHITDHLILVKGSRKYALETIFI